jgi:hypothetical protein
MGREYSRGDCAGHEKLGRKGGREPRQYRILTFYLECGTIASKVQRTPEKPAFSKNRKRTQEIPIQRCGLGSKLIATKDRRVAKLTGFLVDFEAAESHQESPARCSAFLQALSMAAISLPPYDALRLALSAPEV